MFRCVTGECEWLRDGTNRRRFSFARGSFARGGLARASLKSRTSQLTATGRGSTSLASCIALLCALVSAAWAQGAWAESDAAAPAPSCISLHHKETDYAVCRFDPARSDIRLFLNNDAGEPYAHFNWVNEALTNKSEKLAFAMNAGMYHEDRSPVGLYVESGEELAPLNDNDGPGNFHLKPNGVFFINDSGVAGVQQTSVFKTLDQEVRFATQSGPMLVIDGAIHPRFLPDSDSLKRRNGAGVTADGEVIFVLADTPVRFYDFAVFFRDELKTPNALYLDGTISRLFAPELERNDPGVAMGPIVAVVVSDE